MARRSSNRFLAISHNTAGVKVANTWSGVRIKSGHGHNPLERM